jgi:hypothetical protein
MMEDMSTTLRVLGIVLVGVWVLYLCKGEKTK